MGRINFFKKYFSYIIWAFFCLYLLILIKVILFKYPKPMIIEIIKQNNIFHLKRRVVNSNFIPFKTILCYLTQRASVRISKLNLIGNIAAFIPLGFLSPFLFPIKIDKIYKIITISFIISFIFEIIQLITGIGVFDIDDLILNILGAILGFVLHENIKCLYKIRV